MNKSFQEMLKEGNTTQTCSILNVAFPMNIMCLFKCFTEFESYYHNTETKLGDMDDTGRSNGDNERLSDSVHGIIRKMDEKLQSVTEKVGRERNLRKMLEEKLDQLKRDLQAAENKALHKAENNGDIDWEKKSGKEKGCESGGMVEERVMVLERRMEELEREAVSLKVSSEARDSHKSVHMIYTNKYIPMSNVCDT